MIFAVLAVNNGT